MTQKNTNMPVRSAKPAAPGVIQRCIHAVVGFWKQLPRDINIMLLVGIVVVAASVFLQIAWPGGFPLQNGNRAQTGAVSQVYATGAVRLNEIMSSNSNAFTTPEGETADWVEIINAGSSEIDLKGYSLAKNSNSPTFTFPSCILQPGECVMVFCSGQLQAQEGATLYAPFRLSSGGDSVMLFNTSGTAIDTVNLPALSRNESYIRTGSTQWQATRAYTPGLENTQENYMSLVSVTVQDVVQISEIMASSLSYARDFDGEYCDYIELHNTSSEDVNLKGYFLSDSMGNPTRWCFPDVVIPANGYIFIYASGKNTVRDGQIHTNFRVGSEGEQIVLANPKGQPVNIVNYGVLRADKAYSRMADGSFTATLPPSPGAANQ